MKKASPQASLHRAHGLKAALPAMVSLLLVWGLSGCDKPADGQSAGQKLDSVIAKTQEAAAEAKLKTEASGAEIKAKTEETFAQAGAAMKDATQHAESSAKVAAGKAIEKMDDMAITAAITAELVKDPEIKALGINVDTKGGVVTLNGTVPTEAVRQKAGATAKTFSGVQSLDNRLIVKAG